jgi:hypothetical protein
MYRSFRRPMFYVPNVVCVSYFHIHLSMGVDFARNINVCIRIELKEAYETVQESAEDQDSSSEVNNCSAWNKEDRSEDSSVRKGSTEYGLDW